MADYSVKRLANGRTMRQLMFALTFLAASLAVCWSYQREIYSRMMGAVIATPQEIAAIPSFDAAYQRLFEMNAPDALVLPFRDETVHRRKGRETGRSYRYFHLVKATPPLLLRAGVDKLAFPVTGALMAVPDDVRARMTKINPEFMKQAGIAAVMLDVEDPVFSFDSLLAMAALAAPFLFLGLLIRAVLRMMNFERVPAVAALKRFNAPVEQTVAGIDAELKAGDPTTPVGHTLLTPSWLTNTHRSKLDVVKLDDLVWLYSAVLTKKIYGLIPYWKSHSLHLADRHGKIVEIKGGKKALPELAGSIMQRVPWVIGGYTDEIEQIWKRSRQTLIDAVDDRRRQVQVGAVQGTQPAAPEGQAGA